MRTFLHENSVHTGRTTPIFSLCLYFDVSNTPGKLHFTRCDVITVTKSVHRQSDTPVVVPATTGVFRTIFCHDDTHVHTHKDKVKTTAMVLVLLTTTKMGEIMLTMSK